MAKNYESLEYMHNSIYNKNLIDNQYNKRKAKIYFSEPDAGVNEETGILLFIAGYGGNANSNIYKKMRQQFADRYNLVTIQCDYFGYEFMQSSESVNTPEFDFETLNNIFSSDEMKEIYFQNKLDLNKVIKIGSKYNLNLNVTENLSGETLDNFNDMGIIQALDNIVAVLKVMSIIYENGFQFNTKKVIIYGQSQGSYLSYLCNRFCPGLFSNIIDNSSWLYPQYLLANRCVTYNIGKLNLNVQFEYLARKLNLNNKILDLNYLYSNFKNNCDIISYHGIEDKLINHNEKKDFCKKIDKCVYNEINEDIIDGMIFKSTEHGLGADFINLFDNSYNKFTYGKDIFLNLPKDVAIKTDKNVYLINYKDILPILTVI
jgi:hypothetical protein